MKAIIPAAGLGTRLHPLTLNASKETLPVDGIPAIEHVIKELRSAGVDDILVVLRKEKKDLYRFLDDNFLVTFVWQETPAGLGDAIYQCKEFIEEKELFLVALPDVLVPSHETFYLQCLAKKQKDPVIGLNQVSKEDAKDYGIATDFVVYNEYVDITEIEEKPKEYRGNLAITGRYLIDSRIFEYLRSEDKDFTAALLQYPRLLGCIVNGSKDIGTLRKYMEVCGGV